MDYLKALQYGVIGLIAIMLIRASMLLSTELGNKIVRPEAARLIVIFLVFCVVLACISGVVQILDSKGRQKIERAHQIGEEAKAQLQSKELMGAQVSSQSAYDNIILRLKVLADELLNL